MAEELVFHNASGEKSGDEDYYSYFEDQVINDVVRDLGEKTGYETTIVRKMLMNRRLQDLFDPQPRRAGRQLKRSIRTSTTFLPRQARSSCSPALSSLTTRPETSSLLPAAWVKSREA